jgi:hypothetical protein
MIRCVVYLLLMFKMFQGLMNNAVFVYVTESFLEVCFRQALNKPHILYLRTSPKILLLMRCRKVL